MTLSPRTLLSTPEQILKLVEILRTQEMISFDTEFIRETTFFPDLAILQIATETESWAVDVLAFRGSRPAGLEPLLNVFGDPKILKVLHASQGDQECLYTRFGIVATPSLDTALAASLCGYGDSIGLASLMKSALGVVLKKGHARTNWAMRPLPEQLLDYALADVDDLVRLGKNLIAQLKELNRLEWAFELSSKFEDTVLYSNQPELIAQRLFKSGKIDRPGYPVLLELVRWRENRVRELNVPRKWVADDQMLLDLARVKPKDIEHLQTFRGLNKGEIKKNGQRILESIQSGMNAKDIEIPEKSRFEPPSEDEDRSMDLVRCFLGILADQNRISARHLISTSDILRLVRARGQSPEQWVEDGIFSQGALRLVGEEVQAILSGKRALSLEGPASELKVKVVEV